MDDYIKREAAIEICEAEYQARLRMCDYCGDTVAWNIGSEIKALPAADVVPVVHGEWEVVDWREYDANSCEVICYPKEGIACTRCRYAFKKDALWKKNFCPNCGARMDGDSDAKAD